MATFNTSLTPVTLTARPVDRAGFAATAASLGVDAATAAAAADNLASGRVLLLAVSGKIASGKDTVAPAVFDALGLTDREHQYYARPLKDEVDEIIADLRTWDAERTRARRAITPAWRAELGARLEAQHNLPAGAGVFYAGRLYDQVRMHPGLHSRSRTAVIRQVLQQHGTEVRRAQDPDYWVKLALAPAIRALAAGTSVFFTDARFPNEVTVAATVGAFSVRLDIDPDTQLARLAGRDGAGLMSPEALAHSSELALDDYDAFDVRFANDGTLADAIAQITAALGAGRVPAVGVRVA